MRRRRNEVMDFFEADDGRGTWTIREHSAWRRQWLFVRRVPIIVKIILFLFWLEFTVALTFIMWLVIGTALSK